MKRFFVVRITGAFLMLLKVMAHMGACVARAGRSELLQRPDTNIQILDDTHRLTKRMDLELCLGQFDVHQNTIIRTGESQAIGGKYLQGLELDTMDECQRLCCETESCDVYIFENKNDGYCYLFECGPSENFHCKFTRHANYTSAVLTPAVRRPLTRVTTTRSPSLSHTVNASNISQQEWELINLKMKPPEILKDVKNPIIPNDAKINPNNLSSKVGDTVQSPQCGRFQFPCHSGECIAVYNACDGIPQCEDGSDEGPECSNFNSNDVAITHPKPDISKANHQISIAQYQPAAASMIPQTAQQQLQSMQQLASSHYKPSASIINNREDSNAWEKHQIITNEQSVKHLNEYHGGNNGNTLYNQKANVLSPNEDSFTAYVNKPNTKNAQYGSTLEKSGLFVTTQQQQQQQPAQEILVPSLKLPIPTGNNWQQQQQTLTSEQQKQKIQQQQQQQKQQQSVANNTKLVGGSNTLQRQTPLSPQGALPYINNETPAGILQQQQNSISAPQLKTAMSSEQQNIQLSSTNVEMNDQTEKAADEQMSQKTSNNDSNEYEEDSQEKHTEAPIMKKHKHKKMKSKSKENAIETDTTHHNGAAAISVAISPVHEQYKIIHENLAMEFRDHDGLSDRPSGAVLSLTLGVLITSALAVLIGCRMRTVGRRARRLAGKIPFSHEADFLVNGMYL